MAVFVYAAVGASANVNQDAVIIQPTAVVSEEYVYLTAGETINNSRLTPAVNNGDSLTAAAAADAEARSCSHFISAARQVTAATPAPMLAAANGEPGCAADFSGNAIETTSAATAQVTAATRIHRTPSCSDFESRRRAKSSSTTAARINPAGR